LQRALHGISTKVVRALLVAVIGKHPSFLGTQVGQNLKVPPGQWCLSHGEKCTFRSPDIPQGYQEIDDSCGHRCGPKLLRRRKARFGPAKASRRLAVVGAIARRMSMISSSASVRPMEGASYPSFDSP